jgi:nucleotide-binding universal stress UspA family protein
MMAKVRRRSTSAASVPVRTESAEDSGLFIAPHVAGNGRGIKGRPLDLTQGGNPSAWALSPVRNLPPKSDVRLHHHPPDRLLRRQHGGVRARIAVAAQGTLYILHVAETDADEMDAFPPVRATLARWGLLDAGEPQAALAQRLGVRIAKIDLEPQSTADGVRRFVAEHHPDLMVLGTEGRQGLARLLHGSMAERLARAARAPTLFVPARARGFVDQSRGDLRLRRVLIPVDHAPPPAHAVSAMTSFTRMLAGDAAEDMLLHVGTEPPWIVPHGDADRPLRVALRRGDAVEQILHTAIDWGADLIGMPTAGHKNVLDTLLGSTAERVVRQAPCPVLVVPVA